MEKNVQELTAAEYREELRKARLNPPAVTLEEARQQYLEVTGNRGKIVPCAKPAPSGGGRKKTVAV